jgi:hypothetical protein
MLPPRFLLMLVLGLLIGSLGAMALGHLHPLPPAIRELLNNCAGVSGCWHGVRPGEALLEEAEQVWRESGYRIRRGQDVTFQQQVQAHSDARSACRLYANAPINQTQVVQEMLAFYCTQPPTLGDLILAMGAPVVQVRCPRLGTALLRLPGNTQLNLWWGIGERWTPFVRIDSLLFNVRQAPGSAGQHRWRGFAPAWRYCAG